MSVDLVDAAISDAGAAQKRVRRLPTRVVVYVLLAGVLFAEVGYQQVLRRLVCGAGLSVKTPGSSALSQAFRRIGVAPLRELFDLVRGAAAGTPRWHGLLVCAIDGTTMFVPDTDANAAAFGRQTGRADAPAGYPMLRLVSILACGSRTVLGAVFGSYRVGETTYAPGLADSLRPGMVLLGDRNFAATALLERFADTGADLLIRCKNTRRFQVLTHLPDGTRIVRLGQLRVRLIDARITVVLGSSGRQHTGANIVIAGGVVSGTWSLTDDEMVVAWFAEAWPPPRDALAAETERLATIVDRPLQPTVQVAQRRPRIATFDQHIGEEATIGGAHFESLPTG